MTPEEVIAPVVLLVVCGAYVFWPQQRLAREHEKTRLDYLLERKEVIYENLRDLNFEFRAGKYPPEDYEAQRTALESEAASVLSEIESAERAQTAV